MIIQGKRTRMFLGDPPEWQEEPVDKLCEHGWAVDMHCCECSQVGFLFDWMDCMCSGEVPTA